MLRKALCCCRSCSIEMDGEPSINAICHCDNCRRRTGSAYGWSVYFDEANLRSKAGDLIEYALVGKAGGKQSRWFCARCGTTLLWTIEARPGQLGFAAGCFVDPLPEPSISASHDKRLDWVPTAEHWRAFS
jgi:hypothetical protein